MRLRPQLRKRIGRFRIYTPAAAQKAPAEYAGPLPLNADDDGRLPHPSCRFLLFRQAAAQRLHLLSFMLISDIDDAYFYREKCQRSHALIDAL